MSGQLPSKEQVCTHAKVYVLTFAGQPDEYAGECPFCVRDRLKAEIEVWRLGCTGKHGSQETCVSAPEPGAIPFAGVVQGVNYEAIAENPPPLEREEWTPQQALEFYAAGRHFDVVNGRTRILDTGAIASDALKQLSAGYAEMKGLEPASAPPPGREWQPIETAPKGDVLLLCRRGLDGDWSMHTGYWFGRKGWTTGAMWLDQMTHWMPLPECPTATKGEG